MCTSDTLDEDDDLYDFVEDEENEGDEIYEDLMRPDEQPGTVSEWMPQTGGGLVGRSDVRPLSDTLSPSSTDR